MSSSVIAGALGKAAAPVAMNVLRSYGKQKYDELVASYTNILDKFIAASLYKCSKVKTLLNGEEPVDLADIYVRTFFHNKSGSIADASLLKKLQSENGAYVISGLAGSGKSMFMKHAVCKFIDEMVYHQRVPLFIEVRDLDHSRDTEPLENQLFAYCSSSDNNANFVQFLVGLKEGLFIIMLDGVDETPVDKLDIFLKKISAFHQRYRQCMLVASSRPGTKLSNISLFKTYQVSSMLIDQVLEVVERAPLELRRKQIFCKALSSGLYDKHQSFLSNPLLVTIVLITFDDASRVPDYLTGFYGAAFDALFGRHDWSKGVYVRDHKSGLEKQQFEKVFMYFCYIAYLQGRYTFEKDQALSIVEQSLKQAKVNTLASSYIYDCVVSVCLLQTDEPKITFVHRSFQEYFTAKLISSYSGPKLKKIIDFIVEKSETDSTFIMAAQINKESVIRHWGIPTYIDLIAQMRAFKKIKDFSSIINLAGIHSILFTIDNGGTHGFGIDRSDGFSTIDCLMYIGSDEIDSSDFMFHGNMYGGKTFAELPDDLQALLKRKSDSEGNMAVGVQDDIIASRLSFESFSTNIIDQLETSYRYMQNYIDERDYIVDLLEI